MYTIEEIEKFLGVNDSSFDSNPRDDSNFIDNSLPSPIPDTTETNTDTTISNSPNIITIFNNETTKGEIDPFDTILTDFGSIAPNFGCSTAPTSVNSTSTILASLSAQILERIEQQVKDESKLDIEQLLALIQSEGKTDINQRTTQLQKILKDFKSPKGEANIQEKTAKLQKIVQNFKPPYGGESPKRVISQNYDTTFLENKRFKKE